MTMNLPKRKDIRLKNFDYSSPNSFFITICTQNRQCLFGTIRNGELQGADGRPDLMVEEWILKLEQKYPNLQIDTYVVMPDHVHILLHNPGVEPTKAGDHMGSPLPQIVSWFKTMTTNAYIRGVKCGKYRPFEDGFWQRNYYEHGIRGSRDLDELRQYIAENPFHWTAKR